MPPKRGIVLDPFCGSGTTLMAAVLEGHDFIGVDLQEEYVMLATERATFARKHRKWLLAELEKREKQKTDVGESEGEAEEKQEGVPQ